jgi:hypothetical protein
MEIPRITGMPQAIPNGLTKDIRFIMTIENGEPVAFVSHYGVAIQIASTLGAAVDLLRTGLTAQGEAVSIPAPQIREVRINKTLLGDMMAIELITTMGFPFVFQFPVHMSESIADRLKSEAVKDRPAGRA